MSTLTARSSSIQKVTKTGLVPVLDDAAWLAKFAQSRKAAPPVPVVNDPETVQRHQALRELDEKIAHSSELLTRLVAAIEAAKADLAVVHSSTEGLRTQIETRAKAAFLRLSDMEDRLRKRAEHLGTSLTDDVSFSDIIAVVATVTGVPVRELKSDRRRGPTAAARHLIYWLGVNCTALSLPAIGLRMGKDHTSVLHGARIADRVAVLEGIKLDFEPTPAELSDIVGRLFRSEHWAIARRYDNKNMGKRRRWEKFQGKIAP